VNARVLRIELRRSTALFAAALIAALGAFILYTSNERYPWWISLVIVQRDILQAMVPLALGLGAWQALRDRRSKVEELLGTTALPRWRRVVPLAAAMALAAVTGYLLMFAISTGHLRALDGYFPVPALAVIAVGGLAMVASVLLGLGIGRLWPSPLTPLLVIVVSFVVLAIVPPNLRRANGDRNGITLLSPTLQHPRSGSIELEIISTRVNLLQALWLCAVAASGVALFAAATRLGRVAALAPALLAAAVVTPLLPASMDRSFVPDTAAAAFVCTRDAPKVCVPRVYATVMLDRVRGPARQALALMAQKLPDPPTRVEVHTESKATTEPQAADVLWGAVPLDFDGTLAVPDEYVLLALLSGAGTRRCRAGSDAEAEYEAARMVAALWLSGGDVPPEQQVPPGAKGKENPGDVQRSLDALRAVPAEEQRARVAALRRAELACAPGNRLDLLTGAGGTP